MRKEKQTITPLNPTGTGTKGKNRLLSFAKASLRRSCFF
jgi:hypothetical protein